MPAILHNEVHISQTQRHQFKAGHYGYGNGISYGSNSMQHTTTTPLVEALTPPPKPMLPNKPQPPKTQGRATNALAIAVLIIGVLALPGVLLLSLFLLFFFFLYGFGLLVIVLVLFLRALSACSFCVLFLRALSACSFCRPTRPTSLRQQEYLQALGRWEQLVG